MRREEDHPRDEQGRFTAKDINDMSAAELKEYIMSNDTVSGAIYGAYTDENDPKNKLRERFANNYCNQILNGNRQIEIKAISENSNMKYKDVEKIFVIFSN